MFDVNNILYSHDRKQYLCGYLCNSPEEAQNVVANNIRISRILSMSGEMFPDENIAYIGAGTANDVRKIIEGVNANYFMPPLNIFVFYGSSRKGLESRWCVGFDFSDSSRLINFLNMYDQTVIADNNPQNWQDKNGKTYSIVIPTGIKEKLPVGKEAELLDQRINLFLTAIRNTTFRKIKSIPIQ